MFKFLRSLFPHTHRWEHVAFWMTSYYDGCREYDHFRCTFPGCNATRDVPMTDSEKITYCEEDGVKCVHYSECEKKWLRRSKQFRLMNPQ
jgi:hypothetical protein